MLTYILPTHNRPERLQQTLNAIGALSLEAYEPIGGAEIIIVDNASDHPTKLPRPQECSSTGLPLRVLRREINEGAAARNVGVQHAQGEWIIMLDDDSYPLDSNHVELLLNADDDVAAIGADIFLPDGNREAGGLPEVFIGCGVAIRRQAFLDAGGYDASFDYYAEEYDLSAKLILNGWRIVHDRRFRVRHEKVAAGRDMNRILHRLTRNNCWVMQRYAPAGQRESDLAEIVSRYGRIAIKENAAFGFARGMADLLQTIDRQSQHEMSANFFDRFTGLAHVRQAVINLCSCDAGELASRGSGCDRIVGKTIAIVDEGKNAWAVRQALHEMEANVIDDESAADVLIIGTLSPGPMMDSFERRFRLGQAVVMPWVGESAGSCCGFEGLAIATSSRRRGDCLPAKSGHMDRSTSKLKNTTDCQQPATIGTGHT